MADESAIPPTLTIGLTDAVREVLKAGDRAMTPAEVRDGLIRLGINPDDYTNLLASVHNVLKRLAKANEVDAGHTAPKGTKGCKAVYYWSPTREPIKLRAGWDKRKERKG